jgi:hypothetical protein
MTYDMILSCTGIFDTLHFIIRQAFKNRSRFLVHVGKRGKDILICGTVT